MKEYRSASQILFGYLPEQTVDLQNGIWKIRNWREPILQSSVDMETLRRELIRQAMPWHKKETDGGFVNDLYQKRAIRVYSLDKENGVNVEPFPRIWICKSCNRISTSQEEQCRCGYDGRTPWAQLHFVGYHDACGAIQEPYIPRCKIHKDVKIVFPGTTSVLDIRFVCPACNTLLQTGFGGRQCQCGQGRLSYNVHRSSQVYTPRSVVVVNPPSREKLKKIMEVGGSSKALSWVINGMNTQTMEEIPNTRESLRQQLLAQNLSEATVNQMLQVAENSTDIAFEEENIELCAEHQENAEAEAVTIALAVSESRLRIQNLVDGTISDSELGKLYRDKYPSSLQEAGLASVELLDKFPVLTGNYAYTRGSAEPGVSRLVPFRHQSGDYVVYADVAETEALFLQLDSVRVAEWLQNQGYSLPSYHDAKTARISILQSAQIPSMCDTENTGLGTALLTLIHSYAHRFIRHAAVYAGIDRSALSELLVPLHLGFFVYASARGDFVLGGLQAVFETELDGLLRAVVREDHRCPLDPGCMRASGACMACLHLGEPSCQYFNRYLNRKVLSGDNGYLRNFL